MDLMTEDCTYLWDKDTAHFEIAKLCLDYLSRPWVKEIIKQSYQVSTSNVVKLSIFPNRQNLCSYALQAWTYHLSMTPSYLGPLKLVDRGIPNIWLKGAWALANPITRHHYYPKSLYSVLIGMDAPYDSRTPSDDDFDIGLVEAVGNSRAKAIKNLLQKKLYAEEILLDVLSVVSSSGEEQKCLI